MDNNPNVTWNNQPQYKVISGNTGQGLKRASTSTKVVGNGKKNAKSSSFKETQQQQIIVPSRQAEANRAAAPMTASQGLIVRPANGSSLNTMKGGSIAQQSSQALQKTTKNAQSNQTSYDRIKINNELGQQNQVPAISGMPHVPSTHIQVSHAKKSAAVLQSKRAQQKGGVESSESTGRQNNNHSRTQAQAQRKQYSGKFQSRKSSNTIAQGNPSMSGGSDFALNSMNQNRGQIITFDERAHHDIDDNIIQNYNQIQQMQQINTLQTIITERDMRTDTENDQPLYDFLPDNRSIKVGAGSIRQGNANSGQDQQRRYISASNENAAPSAQESNFILSKFADLRHDLLNKMTLINQRLDQVESTLKSQQQQIHQQQMAPRQLVDIEGLPGYNSNAVNSNAGGFADTVKVTFSNTKANGEGVSPLPGQSRQIETPSDPTVRAKRQTKRRNGHDSGEAVRNEDESQIVDVKKYVMGTNQGKKGRVSKRAGDRTVSAEEQHPAEHVDRDDNFRRSMREVMNRKNSIHRNNGGHTASSGAVNPGILDQQSDRIDQLNLDIKSPIQQELRHSKVASQERVQTYHYLKKEKGKISQSQRQQLRTTQQRGRDQGPSGSKQSGSTKVNPFANVQDANGAPHGAGHAAKCSSSLSQSRKNEKIIELNQKLLKSPNIVHDRYGGAGSKKDDHHASNAGNRGTMQSVESSGLVQTNSKQKGKYDQAYKNFLENDDKQMANPANFGTFGGKGVAMQWTQNDEGADSIKIGDLKDQDKQVNQLAKQNSEKVQHVPGSDIASGQQRLFRGGNTLNKSNKYQLSQPKLMSSSTFSNGEIDGGAEDFDERLDQRQYQHNISQKSHLAQSGKHELEGPRLSEIGPLSKHKHNNQHTLEDENDEDDDDGGFLSDEVDERRSYTPQPRQASATIDENKDDKFTLNNPINISQMTIDNENNATIMNLSKITKVNDTVTNEQTHNRLTKKQSAMLPSTGQTIRIGNHIQNNNTIFIGQQLPVGGQSQVIFPSSANQIQPGSASANTSFISGMQALNALNGVQNSNPQNRQLQMKKPGTVLGHMPQSKGGDGALAPEVKGLGSARSGGAGSSVPLTARVNSNQIAANIAQNHAKEPRVKSLQRQPIVAHNDAKSGINTIYKSPVRNVGGTVTSLGKPRSAYGGDAKQNHNSASHNNNNFGPIFIQNLRELSGIRNNPGVQQSTSRQGADGNILSTSDLSNALLNANNLSRQNAQNQMAQNLRKTPGTSMGLMTSVKSQNNSHGRSQQPYAANSFNLNMDMHQNSLITGLQAANSRSQHSHSFKHNLHALMAQKGSKCKCLPADFDDPEEDTVDNDQTGNMQSNVDIFTRNEPIPASQTPQPQPSGAANNEQDFEEISMGSVGGGSDEVGSAQEHRPAKMTAEEQRRLAKQKRKKKFCSSYCKRIGPKEQRQIILECLRIEVNEIEEGKVTLFKGQGHEIEQTFLIKSSFNKLQRYIIDAKWWAKWCDYTNFDQNDILLEHLDFNKKEQGDDPLRKQQQISEQQLQNYLSAATNRRFESTQLYQKPPRIENEGLLEQRNFEGGIGGSGIDAHFTSIRGLRENLTQHYDFEALYPSIWLHLYSWYSADTQIARYLKIDSFNQEDMLGSMGSTTLKQALAEGEFKDQDGKNKFKKMELDLYPSKLNAKAFKNQYYHFEDFNLQKENENKLLSSEQRKQNSGPVNTEPAQKEAGPSTSMMAANTSAFGFNISGFNKMLNQTSMEKTHNNGDNNANSSPSMQNLSNSNNNGKKVQSFIDKRTSLQGFLGRHQSQNQGFNDNQKKGKQSSVGPAGGAATKHAATNSGGGNNNIEIQQKRNSYSFNRKEQQKISPQNEKRFQNGMLGGNGPGSSTSPAQEGTWGLKKKGADESSGPGTASLGQKMMSYFYNK